MNQANHSKNALQAHWSYMMQVLTLMLQIKDTRGHYL